jgi:hypothetical protein
LIATAAGSAGKNRLHWVRALEQSRPVCLPGESRLMCRIAVGTMSLTIFYKPISFAGGTIKPMKKAIRTVVYDDRLRIEAYRFEGIVQPFPNHFHEYYGIGLAPGVYREIFSDKKQYGGKAE